MKITTEHAQFTQIDQRIAPGSTVRQVWPLAGGISATMTAFALEHLDGRLQKLIVRRPGPGAIQHNPAAAQAEFQILQLTQRLGLATQTPYYLDTSGTIFDTPYLVIDYIEGQPTFAPDDPVDCAQQIATQLAQIHHIDGAQPELAALPRQPSGFSEIFGTRPSQVAPTLAEAQLRAIVTAAWPLAPRNAPVLLHGDFWPGNLLWREGKLVAVIDWEDAKIGDPLIDFAISRLDLLTIFGRTAMSAFTEQYQALLPIDYTDLPYWDLYAALRLVRLADANFADWATFFVPFGRTDITEQSLNDDYQFFVGQALASLASAKNGGQASDN